MHRESEIDLLLRRLEAPVSARDSGRADDLLAPWTSDELRPDVASYVQAIWETEETRESAPRDGDPPC